jgi:hypothetical protein
MAENRKTRNGAQPKAASDCAVVPDNSNQLGAEFVHAH